MMDELHNCPVVICPAKLKMKSKRTTIVLVKILFQAGGKVADGK